MHTLIVQLCTAKTLIRCNFEFIKRNDEKDENSLQDQSLFEVVFLLYSVS